MELLSITYSRYWEVFWFFFDLDVLLIYFPTRCIHLRAACYQRAMSLLMRAWRNTHYWNLIIYQCSWIRLFLRLLLLLKFLLYQLRMVCFELWMRLHWIFPDFYSNVSRIATSYACWSNWSWRYIIVWYLCTLSSWCINKTFRFFFTLIDILFSA